MEKHDRHYAKVYLWLAKNFGKANFCEFGDHIGRRYEWALKEGCEYDFKRENFIQLCPSCHRKYDETEDKKKNRSVSMKKSIYRNRIADMKCSLGKNKGLHPTAKKIIDIETNVIYECVSEASRINGIKISTLSMMLTGKNNNRTNLRYYE